MATEKMREMTFFFSHDIRICFETKIIIINCLNFSLILIPNLQKQARKLKKNLTAIGKNTLIA